MSECVQKNSQKIVLKCSISDVWNISSWQITHEKINFYSQICFQWYYFVGKISYIMSVFQKVNRNIK